MKLAMNEATNNIHGDSLNYQAIKMTLPEPM